MFAFSVTLPRAPPDESNFEFEFIPSLPTPTHARISAVLHPSLSAAYKGYVSEMLRFYDIKAIATPATDDEFLEALSGFDNKMKANGGAAAGTSVPHA